jgi:hypothetical protein
MVIFRLGLFICEKKAEIKTEKRLERLKNKGSKKRLKKSLSWFRGFFIHNMMKKRANIQTSDSATAMFAVNSGVCCVVFRF